MAMKSGTDVCRKDRSWGNLNCTFRSNVALVDLLGLKAEPSEPYQLHKFLGLAAGFPVAVNISYDPEGTVGAYVDVGMWMSEGILCQRKSARRV